MIHRAPFGSLERFIGVLIEHNGGNFPTWLAPVQVMVLPISHDFNEYGQSVLEELRGAGLRAELDDRNEKVGYRIRSAEMQKVPYMLVVGRKEVEDKLVAVRRHGQGAQETVAIETIIDRIEAEIAEELSRE